MQGPITSEPPTTFTYDSNGTLSTTTDPLNHQTRRLYDAVSRLTRLTAPHGFATQFRYDALNRVTDIADARQGAHGGDHLLADGVDLRLGRIAEFDVEGNVAAIDPDVLEGLAGNEILARIGIDRSGQRGLPAYA